MYLGNESSTGGSIFASSSAYASVFGNKDNKNLEFFSGGKVLTLTSSGAATFASSITNSGNLLTYKTGGGGTVKQVVVGQTTAAASGVTKKIAYVGHTNAIVVYLWASQSTSSGTTAIANITTIYGASSGGVSQTSGASGNVTAISCAYNNGGSPTYTIDVAVTYTGTAPTINYVIEGINNDNSIYTI
jgi:hypothetical protein